MTISALRARDLMTHDVVSVPPTMPIAALARMLADRGLSSVAVADAEGRLVGMVSEVDLVHRYAGGKEQTSWLSELFDSPDRQAERYVKSHGVTAEDVMTPNPVSITEDTDIAEITRLMEEKRIKRLPVLRDGKLVGMVSRSDMLRAVLSPPQAADPDMASRDKRIREALRKEMREQPWVSTFYTFADVKDGVVTLHGYVRSDAVRRALVVMAGGIDGVVRVEDNLALRPVFLPGEAL